MADEQKKTAPLPWVILTGLLGVFAVGVPQVGTNAPAKKEAKKDPDPPAAQIAIDDPLKPVFDFHKSREVDAKNRDADGKAEQEIRDRIHGYRTEFLIATVPDPIDSPYGNAFDQVIDAIQRAVEKKDGYVLDRCWLPWDADRRAKPKDGQPPPNLHAIKPGLLLFRHGKDKARRVNSPALCAVLLVGETPMGGIHKQAMYAALKLMADSGHPATEPVRIVGPHFSGSQTSLQFVIGDWWAQSDSTSISPLPAYRFKIITGNATAVRKSEYFSYESNKDAFPSWRKDGVTFSSTVIPTRMTLGALLHFLARRDGSSTQEPIGWNIDRLPGKVAILAETNTAFGKQFDDLTDDQLITLRFPLHISRVKNEYNSAAKDKDKKAGLADDDPLLALSIDDENTGSHEGVPAQGGSTTTATNGQVLARILQTVSREQCRYVGVIASDTRDKLFLIRLIREHCPDVCVFVTDGDLLLTHPEYQYYMRGVLIGSTYPLVPRNQNWVHAGSRERILFPSVGAQGYYNATLMHLGLTDQLLEYAAPTFALAEPNRPELADNRPPVWISMVAPNGTIVPLQLYTRYEDKYGYLADVPDRTDESPDIVGLDYPGALLPVGLGLLAWWALLIARAWGNPNTRLFWRSGSLLTLPDLFYRNIILGSQVLLAVPLLGVVGAHAVAHHWAAWDVAFVSVAVFCLAALTLGTVKPLVRRGAGTVLRGRPLAGKSGVLEPGAPAGRVETATWVLLNLGLYLLVLGFATLFVVRFWAYGDFARRALFFVRAVDLGTGVSPLTPLFFVCTGYAAWGFFQLKRTHLAERYFVPNPYPPGESFRRLHAADADVRDEVSHEAIAVRHAKPIGGSILALGAFGVAVWLQSLPTVEGWAWDLLFFFGFAGLFLLSATTLVRLFFLWGRVKGLLDAVAAQPMMRAFGRLPVKVTEVFGRYLFTQRPHLSHLQVPAHQLRLLVEAVDKDPEAPAGLRGFGGTADEIDSILADQLAGGRRRGTSRRAERMVRQRLSDVAGKCLEVLAPRGRWLAVDDAFGGGTGQAADEKAEPAWVPLAESVAATQVVIYISQFFVQLRNLVWAAVVTASLLLMAATSYPFHPEKLLLIGLIVLSGAGIAGVLYVLIDMNRDELVSRVTKTTPGKFSLDSGFIGSFFTYIVPVAGVVTAQLSGSFRWVLEPLLRVMK